MFSIGITGAYINSSGMGSFSLMASSTYALYVALGFRSMMFLRM